MSFPAASSGNPVRAAGALLLRLALPVLWIGSACGGDRESDPMAAETGRAAGPAASQAERAGANGAAGALDVERTAPPAEVAELAALLARAGEPGALAEGERAALEQTMERLLQPGPSACDDCRTSVTYVDEEGGGDHFRCGVRAADGDLLAELEVFHRADFEPSQALDWARSTLAGHPASGLAGELLFVWPGRFEIRAFRRAALGRRGSGRAAEGGGESARSLEDLLSSLPLDALARL